MSEKQPVRDHRREEAREIAAQSGGGGIPGRVDEVQPVDIALPRVPDDGLKKLARRIEGDAASPTSPAAPEMKKRYGRSVTP